jgi:threonine dehydrogenase-like Zn-dependent dehydrogenase
MMIESQVAFVDKPYQLNFKIDKINTEAIGEHSIICETEYSVISPGTEIAAYIGAQPLRPGQVYPRLVGYCNVATVLYCGSKVKNHKVGERVLSHSSHRSHFEINENEILAKIPANISSTDAVFTYLYHLGYDAVIKSSVKYGTPLVIIGLGVIGLGAVAIASNSGASVYTISDNENCNQIALQYGAKGTFSRTQLTDINDALGERLADTIISTTNSWQDWQIALKLCGRNGIISVMGFPGRDQKSISVNPFDSQYFYDKQLRIQAVGMAPSELDKRQFLKFNQKTNIHFLLDQIKLNKLNPELLISGTLPWHQLDLAYQRLIKREKSTMTYLLEWKN